MTTMLFSSGWLEELIFCDPYLELNIFSQINSTPIIQLNRLMGSKA